MGEAMLKDGGPVDADILLSHFHMDHVIGLPVFEPAYQPGNRFRLWAGSADAGPSLQQALGKLMSMPLFPVGLDAFRAQIELRNFRSGDMLRLKNDLKVVTAPLNHPGGAVGYRIEYAGKSLAYVSDTEHLPGGIDENALALARNADLLIYDATYTDDEYPQRIGWGHSTWREGIKLAEAADSRTLVLFHHDPSHDDDFLDAVALAAARGRPGTLVATEGVSLEL
jgi:phosphoribosyl 1,2-cyclic phosphodiesterase